VTDYTTKKYIQPLFFHPFHSPITLWYASKCLHNLSNIILTSVDYSQTLDGGRIASYTGSGAMDGRLERRWRRMHARTSTVFPSPISSANIPPRTRFSVWGISLSKL